MAFLFSRSWFAFSSLIFAYNGIAHALPQSTSDVSPLLPRQANVGFPANIDAPISLDVGDNSTYEAPEDTLCKRGPFSVFCSVGRPGDCYNPYTGDQTRLQDLNPSQRTRIWDYAKTNGATMRKKMNTYVSQKKSRLIEPEFAKQDDNSQNWYRIPKELATKQQISAEIAGMDAAFKAAGCAGVDGDAEFPYIEIFPMKPILDVERKPQVCLEMGASGSQSVIVSTASFAENDSNSPENRAYSSTLTWLSWKMLTKNDQARALKYHMRAYVNNDETVNTMRQAHRKFPQKVTDIGPDGDVDGGHGVWVPGDEAYDALLNSPNVKVSVNMIIDRNPEMDNPYITEIHTFGEQITSPDTNAVYPSYGRFIRHPMIIIKYGKPPDDIFVAEAATVETS